MKGRGVRVVSPDKLRQVSPSAKVKDRFIIVDAVGACEEDRTDSRTPNRQPSKTLEQVSDYVARGGTDPDALTTLAGRFAHLRRDFTQAQLAELKGLADGKPFTDLARFLLDACDADAQLEAAKQRFGTSRPSEEQVAQATEQLTQAAVAPFMKAAFRRRILDIRRRNEQTIDRHTVDDVLHSGFDAAAVEKARAKVTDFRAWIEAHKDELTALQVLYASIHPLKLSLKDLRELKDALSRPPVSATPVELWRAFEATEADKVDGRGGGPLADLVSLVRHACRTLMPTMTLVPYRGELLKRYHAWLRDRNADDAFTPEQREWLDRMAEHIANSLAIEPEDFETGWFGQCGGHGRAHALFGDELRPLMAELNERLAA